mmetsp:Transcript_34404/g.99139  ORF Transcript_34404/g.99139 Transcript_34404/m.99139 type:complete len:212 (+) Transcript_34404:226-861(+)
MLHALRQVLGLPMSIGLARFGGRGLARRRRRLPGHLCGRIAHLGLTRGRCRRRLFVHLARGRRRLAGRLCRRTACLGLAHDRRRLLPGLRPGHLVLLGRRRLRGRRSGQVAHLEAVPGRRRSTENLCGRVERLGLARAPLSLRVCLVVLAQLPRPRDLILPLVRLSLVLGRRCLLRGRHRRRLLCRPRLVQLAVTALLHVPRVHPPAAQAA